MVTAISTSFEQVANAKAITDFTLGDENAQMEHSIKYAPAFKPHGRTHLGRETIGLELKNRLHTFKQQQTNLDSDDTDIEQSFFIADLGEVYRQFVRWKKNLPRIEPFYAVKCNPDP